MVLFPTAESWWCCNISMAEVSVLGEGGGREIEDKKKLSNIEFEYTIYLKSPFIKIRLFGMLWNVKSQNN